jgi:hypothetical protein
MLVISKTDKRREDNIKVDLRKYSQIESMEGGSK